MDEMILQGETMFWQHVRNLPRAREWYTGIIGLADDDGEQLGEGICVLVVPGQQHMKVALIESVFENPKTHAILDLQVTDIFGVHRLLQSRGAQVEEVRNPAWIYHEFHVTDPEGYRIKIHGFVKKQNA